MTKTHWTDQEEIKVYREVVHLLEMREKDKLPETRFTHIMQQAQKRALPLSRRKKDSSLQARRVCKLRNWDFLADKIKINGEYVSLKTLNEKSNSSPQPLAPVAKGHEIRSAVKEILQPLLEKMRERTSQFEKLAADLKGIDQRLAFLEKELCVDSKKLGQELADGI